MIENNPGEQKAGSKSPTPAGQTPLESWKEISAYLQRDVRTAKRWEKTEGLPVLKWWRPLRALAYVLVLLMSLVSTGSGPHNRTLVQAADGSGIVLRRI